MFVLVKMDRCQDTTGACFSTLLQCNVHLQNTREREESVYAGPIDGIVKQHNWFNSQNIDFLLCPVSDFSVVIFFSCYDFVKLQISFIDLHAKGIENILQQAVFDRVRTIFFCSEKINFLS